MTIMNKIAYAVLLRRIAFTLSVFLIFSPNESHGQVAYGDSMDLIGILQNNCNGCALKDSTSSWYWDTLQPASSWRGADFVNGRLYWLDLGWLNSYPFPGAPIDIDGELSSLDNCTELEWLTLGMAPYTGGGITKLPNLDSLKKLKTLITSFQPLLEFPPLDSLKNLVWLVGGYTPITRLPSLRAQKNLTSLSLSENQIRELPDLDSLENLQSLYVGGNNIENLPNLDALKKLTHLDVSSNLLIELPRLDSLKNLEVLELDYNQITVLPSLDSNTKLQTLDCRYNQLVDLPDLSNLRDFTTLNCSHNNLAKIPLMDSTQIEFLNCTHNNLTFTSIVPYLSSSVDSFAYLPQNNILEIAPHDTLLFLPQSDFILSPLLSGGDSTQIEWFLDGNAIPNATSDTLPQSGSGTYHCRITNPLVPNLILTSQPVYVVQDAGVRCGDTNRDGIINMLDVAPIGLYYGLTGPARPDSIRLSGDSLQPAMDWTDSIGNPLEYQWGNFTINLKHADANGDGILNDQDLDCIISEYSPLQLPEHLKDTVNPGVILTSIPDYRKVSRLDNSRVSVPFVVRIEDLPGDSLKVKGVIFTEPVVQSPHFVIDSMAPSYIGSRLLYHQAQLCGFPMFHPNISIDLNDTIFYPCMDYSSHPLDVGIFNKDSAVWLHPGDQIASCIIDLDDIFAAHNALNIGWDSIPIILFNYNVLMYVEDNSGNLSVLSAQCSSDSIWLDIDSLWNNAGISGVVTSTRGDTIQRYKTILTYNGQVKEVFSQANGTYSELVQWGDSLQVDVEVRNLPPYSANLNAADMDRIKEHVSGADLLTDPYLLIAADLDGSGTVDWDDFYHFDAFLKGNTSSFPIGRFWTCLPADYTFTDSLNPFPHEDARQYAHYTTRTNQDFIAVQLGDIIPGPSNSKLYPIVYHPTDSQAAPVSIFPNPVTEESSIRIFLEEAGIVKISILNSSGETVFQFDEDLAEGTHELLIKKEEIGAGLYLLQYSTSTSHGTLKIMVGPN